MELRTLHDLLLEQLRDLYSAENQLVEALPKMANASSHEELRDAFEQHLGETREHVSRLERVTSLPFRIVYDRLNRRKIDLIPEPEWIDPPKSAIGELLGATEARLRGHGLRDGLREAFELSEQVLEQFLVDPRILDEWRGGGALETLHSYGVPVADAMMGRNYDAASKALAGNQAWVKSGCSSEQAKTAIARSRY